MLYKDLSEEKKAEIRRKARERYAQKKAAKSSLIGPINLEPSNIDQVITSIDGTSNDYQSQIWNAENCNFQQTQLKRCRISVINNNSDGISSLQGASVSTDINLSMTDSDESTFSNSMSDSSMILNSYLDSSNESSTNAQIQTQISEHLTIQQNDLLAQIGSFYFASTISFSKDLNDDIFRNLSQRNRGIYTFRVQGQIYHYISDLIPSNGRPSNLQLYFYDIEHEFENRIVDSTRMGPSIIAQLMDILRVNPYCTFFRYLGDLPSFEYQKIRIRSDPGLDQQVYNAPTSSEVAAIWVEDDTLEQVTPRDIFVYNHVGGSHIVQYYFEYYDPLQYPLLFPFGDIGWHQGIQRINRRGVSISNHTHAAQSIDPHQSISAEELLRREEQVLRRNRKDPFVSCREYYCYKLQIREDVNSILLLSGRLFQQFVVNMYIKIETSRLDYFRSNQQHIRSKLYQGIVDSISVGETNASRIGKRLILPSSFIGGPRDMQKRYMEAMTLVQRYGKPDIFLTITCNPNWKEISTESKPHEETQNRPDLIARIFRTKLEELKHQLFKREIFGKVSAYVYVIEHQKRGLLHAHFLIILHRDWKLYAPESFDQIVSAELLDKDKNLHLYTAVIKHMMHGPCGALNPTNVCMKKNGHCKNNYPRHFVPNTTIGNDCFPIYKRSDDGRTVKIRGHDLDNRWVVPYNSYLLAMFDCHINVEICSTIKAVIYLYKYIYKGHDSVAFNLVSEQPNQQIDEIQQFQSARWIAPPETMWRIYGFIINEVHLAVYSLHLHLENQHQVTFRAHENLNNVINSDLSAKSMLTEFFSTNRVDENTKKLLYKEFPEFYVWSQQYKMWTVRKKQIVIGRIVTANPSEGERYYLRILLNHIRGPLSFDDLKTVNGVLATTFREAATMHGLLERDDSVEESLQEASLYQMPSNLRQLFATILVYCNPTNPRYLWEHFEQDMSSDFQLTEDSQSNVRMQVLRSISMTLESMGRDINSFQLLDRNIHFDEDEFLSREIDDELAVFITEEDLTASALLNREQQIVYSLVLEKIFSNQSAAFFIDGPGGTGKTFLYKALLATIRSRHLIALATASSGVAASILPGAPMSKKEAIEALDRMLKDVNDSELSFGGKVVIFGGDFRQILPVVPKGTRQQQIDASLVSSYLWPTLKKIRLTENMRARLDPDFSNYILELGNGMPPITIDEHVKIPTAMLIPYQNDTASLDQLLDAVFNDISEYSANISSMMNRAILTPKNSYVDEINNLLIQRFPGDIINYYSFDETIDASKQAIMEDFLNILTPNGFPPHQLFLKQNCPIMLLRNINPSEGLCNGTWLICRNFDYNVIHAEIAIGHQTGKKLFKMRPIFTSIKDISPAVKNWKIKMIVAEKSPKRTGQHSPVKYQNLTLIDQEGNRVQATMFGTDIDSRKNSLHIFRSYYITNAFVKPLDPKFRTESYEFQWILNSKTIIEEVPNDETHLKLPKFNFISIDQLDPYKDSIAEIGLSLSSRPTSVFTINPELPEAEQLQKWATINKGTGHDHNESFLCYHCKYQTVAQPRCRAYVELDDGTGKLPAVMFGKIAEEALGYSAVDFMNHNGEEHLPFIENLAIQVSEKQWMLQLTADPEIFNQQQHKNFNVLSIGPVQFGPELQ
ncbi:uncharacterized protein LOC122296677 [Carya illinoinensis]|uniref:uncharacterized protein LOC122296677 n=1 Tax=Carya illinoinensis TaxID=32201 RepID=UPI001C725AAE|nr:uncharacterized protein LOC122296677 [Carya illinoinensis]